MTVLGAVALVHCGVGVVDPDASGSGSTGSESSGSSSSSGGSSGGSSSGGGSSGSSSSSGGSSGGSTSSSGSGGGDGGADAAAPNEGGLPMGTGGCVSGAVGTHVARFRWMGNGPNSTAYVQYEANTLPDASRWKAGAYSRGAIGYTPVFSDTFLGVGGLEMGGTVFIDVELSTASLARLSKVTLAVFGRSFATSSSASLSWMTFDGSGAAPSNAISNVAPYRWYAFDATSAFRVGNAGVLLRISPVSGTLVVNRVELCFDTR
jgi:hypothetical protein